MKIVTAVMQKNEVHSCGNTIPPAKTVPCAIAYMAQIIRLYSINRDRNYASNATPILQPAAAGGISEISWITMIAPQVRDVHDLKLE